MHIFVFVSSNEFKAKLTELKSAGDIDGVFSGILAVADTLLTQRDVEGVFQALTATALLTTSPSASLVKLADFITSDTNAKESQLRLKL